MRMYAAPGLRFPLMRLHIPFPVKFCIILLTMLLAGCNGKSVPEPRAEEGVLDLRGMSLDEIVALKGEWLARAGVDSVSFARYDYSDRHWKPVQVESYFRDHGFPDEGLVWYRLLLRLPADTPPLKGFLQHANNAHVIYAARPGAPPERLAMSGHPSLNADETVLSRRPVIFDLPKARDLVLSWAVANHDYLNGGPFYAIHIGPAEDIDRMVLRQTAMAFLCYGVYILVASFFLLYWALHREDHPSLALGLLALVMAIRSVSISGSLELLFPERMNFAVRTLIDAGTYLSLNGLLAYLLWAFFPFEFAALPFGKSVGTDADRSRQAGGRLLPSWIQKGNTAMLIAIWASSIVFVAIALLGSPQVTSHVLSVARWTSLVLIAPAMVVMVSAVYFRRPLARSVAFGMVILIAGGVHDILLSTGLIKGNPYIATYAFAGFVVVQSIVLVRRNAYHAIAADQDTELLRKQVEQRTKELRAATIAAHAANLAKGQFLSAVSHELRTPLASILGYTEILREELEEELQPQQHEFFHIIHVSAQRLLMLVNDLLDVAKIEAGKLSLQLDVVDLGMVIKDVVDQTYPLVREKDLSLDVQIGEEPVFVRGDWMRLRQVLLNLLSNAVKFTETGGIWLRVYPTEHRRQPAVAIAVQDTGLGISDDFMPHLFDRFTQDQRTYERTQRGTGLGLAISRELVERMGGCIVVESKSGEGSTFTVILLRADLDEPAQIEGAGPLGGDGLAS